MNQKSSMVSKIKKNFRAYLTTFFITHYTCCFLITGYSHVFNLASCVVSTFDMIIKLKYDLKGV